MEDYEIIERLGGGSFADVYKALEKSTKSYVAIKTLKKKYTSFSECLTLRECKSLQKLNNIPFEKGISNIIKLKQIIYIKESGTLNLIFEYMDQDLYELMKKKKKLSEDEIRKISYETLLGLSLMHKYGFFHRDLKPENLLVSQNETIKIADFGLAREIRSIPPYTEYVSTRYYRAPECILKSNNYNSPIDIWALGCIIAEMYNHPIPIFFGNNEKEVLFKINTILGFPDKWNEGINLCKKLNIKLSNSSKVDLKNVINGASDDALDLIKNMLQWDPSKRPNANFLLGHKFFDKIDKNIYERDIDLQFNQNNDNYNVNFSRNFENDIFISRNFDSKHLDGNNSIENFQSKDFNGNYSNNFNNNSFNENNNNESINNDNNGNNKLYDISNICIKEKKKRNQENKKSSLIDSKISFNETNISKILNDTEGFDRLINKLKKEKREEDKRFEIEKNDFNFGVGSSNFMMEGKDVIIEENSEFNLENKKNKFDNENQKEYNIENNNNNSNLTNYNIDNNISTDFNKLKIENNQNLELNKYNIDNNISTDFNKFNLEKNNNSNLYNINNSDLNNFNIDNNNLNKYNIENQDLNKYDVYKKRNEYEYSPSNFYRNPIMNNLYNKDNNSPLGPNNNSSSGENSTNLNSGSRGNSPNKFNNNLDFDTKVRLTKNNNNIQRRSARKFIEETENKLGKQNNKFQFNNEFNLQKPIKVKNDFGLRRNNNNEYNNNNSFNRNLNNNNNNNNIEMFRNNNNNMNNNINNNNNNNILFGMESRRGHNINSNLKNWII